MNFASKYVYDYGEHSDEECVSEEELEHGMTLSDSDSHSDDETGDAPIPVEKKLGGLFGAIRSSLFRGSRGGRTSRAAAAPAVDTESDGVAPPAPPLPVVAALAHDDKKRGEVEKKKKKKKSHWRSAPAGAGTNTQVQGHHWRRADTNVVSIKFDTLKSPSNMHTGDPAYCTGCKAVFSATSKIQQKDDAKFWNCEFCSTENEVDLEPEEVPKQDDVTFMLRPATTTSASGASGVDKSLVVFCVDVSGSMCVTSEVPGKVRLRGSERLDRLQSLNEGHESQWLPGQRRNMTFVSRLQGMQAAVDHQLAVMAQENPDRRVALVAFNNEVSMIGDGSKEEQVVAGDKLKNKDALLKVAEDMPLPGAIKQTQKALSDKVFDLEEKGATALGPALLLSVALAGQVAGSKVIMCTDGMANVGLGSLENPDTYDESSAFYTEVGAMASAKGVSVSVTTIKDTSCKLVELGKVADETGGQVNIVDPLKLTQEFGSILSDPIIAIKVTATFLIHNGLYFRHEETNESRLERYVGNVTKETEVTFEYGVRNTNKKRKVEENKTDTEAGAEADTSSGAGTSAESGPEPALLSQLTELPFQLQITYTDLEGGEALRVLTQTKPITKDRGQAEKDMDVSVMGVHTAQRCAQFAERGEYTNSRLNALLNQRLMSRKAHIDKDSRTDYESFFTNIAPMEQQLCMAQRSERRRMGGRTHSDSEGSDDEDVSSTEGAAKSKRYGKKKPSKLAVTSRRKDTSDDTANMMYALKGAKSKSFNPEAKK